MAIIVLSTPHFFPDTAPTFSSLPEFEFLIQQISLGAPGPEKSSIGQRKIADSVIKCSGSMDHNVILIVGNVLLYLS